MRTRTRNHQADNAELAEASDLMSLPEIECDELFHSMDEALESAGGEEGEDEELSNGEGDDEDEVAVGIAALAAETLRHRAQVLDEGYVTGEDEEEVGEEDDIIEEDDEEEDEEEEEEDDEEQPRRYLTRDYEEDWDTDEEAYEGERDAEEADEDAPMPPRRLLLEMPLLRDWVPPPLNHELADELSLRTAPGSGRGSTPLRGGTKCARHGGARVMSPTQALLLRESGTAPVPQACGHHIAAFHRLPTRPSRVVDTMSSRAYIGRFTADGEIFVAAFQNQRRIRMYDVHRDWKVVKDVHARSLRWTVTDTALSSDQKFLLYASITPIVHLVKVDRGGEDVDSIANITDVHEALHFSSEGRSSHGIWSLAWSADNREIIAGTADRSLHVYDVAAGRSVVAVPAHEDDVNAVAYADESSQLIFTGGDDSAVKVWDRRQLDGRSGSCVGVFVGHCEGITHLDSKGDGRYVISNGKDQTIKLWDVRRMRTPREASRLPLRHIPTFQWDYRWMPYPAAGRVASHPHDAALATYRGHSVLSTLIRAYWSPAHTTGQRYIYSGSADGFVYIYDVVSCQVVAKLPSAGREVVRDCSWHPFLPLMAGVSFDGTVCTWEPDVAGDVDAAADEAEVRAERERPGTGQAAAKAVRRARNRLPVHSVGDQLGDFW